MTQPAAKFAETEELISLEIFCTQNGSSQCSESDSEETASCSDTELDSDNVEPSLHFLRGVTTRSGRSPQLTFRYRKS